LLANPAQTEFLRNFHVELLAAKLDQCRRQERLRLIINLPPRNLKSLCASVALPAWLLGHNPCGFDYLRKLRSRLGRQACSRLPQHHDRPWYQRMFATRLSIHKQSVQEFTTTAQGSALPPRSEAF